MLNQVNLIGNLGQDPDCKVLPSGINVASLRLAVFGGVAKDGGTQTLWLNVECFGDLGERMSVCRKGETVYISGMLRSRQWERDGVTHTSFDVKAHQALKLTRGAENGKGGGRATVAPKRASRVDDDTPF